MKNIKLGRMRVSLPVISETSRAGARSQERWERFGCSPGSAELTTVMESIEGFEEGTR